MSASCCVPGCEEPGVHATTWTITGPPAFGEYEVEALFCCGHLDQLIGENEPFLDLAVIASPREPSS